MFIEPIPALDKFPIPDGALLDVFMGFVRFWGFKGLLESLCDKLLFPNPGGLLFKFVIFPIGSPADF